MTTNTQNRCVRAHQNTAEKLRHINGEQMEECGCRGAQWDVLSDVACRVNVDQLTAGSPARASTEEEGTSLLDLLISSVCVLICNVCDQIGRFFFLLNSSF